MSLIGSLARFAVAWLRRAESRPSEETSLVTSFARLPLREKLSEAANVLRGLWLSRKFDTKGLIRAGRSVKIVKRNGEIHLSRYCHIGDGAHIAVVGGRRKATLSIGNGVVIGAHAQINVTNSITIGEGTFIGWYCDIMDNNFHRVRWLDRKMGPVSQPIVLEDHVFVGAHTIILPGVTIGTNSVIGAGSVVTKSIPPSSFAAGCPARVITEIAGWDPNPYDEETSEAA